MGGRRERVDEVWREEGEKERRVRVNEVESEGEGEEVKRRSEGGERGRKN